MYNYSKSFKTKYVLNLICFFSILTFWTMYTQSCFGVWELLVRTIFFKIKNNSMMQGLRHRRPITALSVFLLDRLFHCQIYRSNDSMWYTIYSKSHHLVGTTTSGYLWIPSISFHNSTFIICQVEQKIGTAVPTFSENSSGHFQPPCNFVVVKTRRRIFGNQASIV